MIPFLSSRVGGFHERLIDLDDRATPEKSLGAAAGPIVTERERERERGDKSVHLLGPYYLHQVVL